MNTQDNTHAIAEKIAVLPIGATEQHGPHLSPDTDWIIAQGIVEEVKKEIDMMANWQLHEEYAYLCFKGLVPRTKYGMVGFGWSKMDYWTAFEEDMTSAVADKVVDRLLKESMYRLWEDKNKLSRLPTKALKDPPSPKVQLYK